MKGVKQKIVNKKTGDCFRACVASILEMPNDNKLPNAHGGDWFGAWYEFFGKMGLAISFDRVAIWREGYWIASVKSKNFKNTSHAIVMKGDAVAFDPSTKKTHRKGTNLLGRGVVNGGYWIEVSDFTKLKEYFKSLNK